VKKHKYRNLILKNLTLSVILVALTPMFLISAISCYRFHVAYTSKVHDHLQELVKKHKKNIDSFLKEKVADIRLLSRMHQPEELNQQEYLKKLLQMLQEEHKGEFVDLGLVNENGIQVAYSGPFNLVNAKYIDAEWFRESMQKSWHMSDVFLGLRGHPHFIVAVQLKQNEQKWTFRSTVDFGIFNSLVENVQIGKTGFAFIINKKGELQSRHGLEIVTNKKELVDFIIKNTPDNQQDINIVKERIKSDQKVLYVITQLNHGNWILVYRQEVSDAYNDLINSIKLTIMILIIGGLTIILTAYFVSRYIVNQITILRREKEIMNEQVIETGKLASIGELAAGIAHEINNPVAIMMEEAGWMSDLLEDDEDIQKKDTLDELKRSINQIYTQGKRCKDITYKLLSFARKTEATSEDMDINQLIEEVIALSAQKVRYNNITINTNLSNDLPLIKASPSEMQQVLLNIINNAHDAMEKKGGFINISTYIKDENIVIQITDNGPGIPSVNLGRIFDPFFTTKPVGKGTGLGLSICYGIIKKIKGEINVQSVVDEGTTFIISLPLIIFAS